MPTSQLWYQFQAQHTDPACRFGPDHPVSLYVRAASVAEAQREVAFICGQTHTITLAPVGEPAERFHNYEVA